MTATLAALFFATSLTLAYLGSKKPEAPKSVIDRVGVPAAPVQDTPSLPAPTTQQQAPADQPVEAPRQQPGDTQTGQPQQQ
jgi:preprotein translocase subunit SecG